MAGLKETLYANDMSPKNALISDITDILIRLYYSKKRKKNYPFSSFLLSNKNHQPFSDFCSALPVFSHFY